MLSLANAAATLTVVAAVRKKKAAMKGVRTKTQLRTLKKKGTRKVRKKRVARTPEKVRKKRETPRVSLMKTQKMLPQDHLTAALT